ncbi:hypothetical protein VVT58_16160 (plasmid) [Sphingobium sp. SJ10-10]|uniref:hypothetical protein n=1 Tax=unclassified Sphingobium TaxID=2611147 RepID=UPI00076FEE34|nr:MULTISPECIES: hypothetical protein [unclassified Sphingobium]AMK25792.1 hypothetical protein K426_24444 [Sphingobium sp. TKS]MEC6701406.1 hypothetical protein [Sphingobium sp. SJ10-10]NML87740.1 hypothetical protein [Sphingobium sp. TB-6]PNQ04346.1 hypothetical protein A8G00_01795 [Sphingobium sp. SA916]
MSVAPNILPAPILSYSQTEPDSRGNFHYEGDLYRQGEALPALCHRIEQHLLGLIAGARFSVSSQVFTGGRKIIVELLDAPADLTDPPARHAFIVMIRDQVERFGFTRSNLLQDFMSCAFYTDIRIGRAYWAALSARRGAANPVVSRISLAAFRKQLKVGDRMTLLYGPKGHRALGTTRTVTAIRSRDFVFEGRTFMDFPRAGAFACDGRLIRIAIGSEHEPDAHLLYEWLPTDQCQADAISMPEQPGGL